MAMEIYQALVTTLSDELLKRISSRIGHIGSPITDSLLTISNRHTLIIDASDIINHLPIGVPLNEYKKDVRPPGYSIWLEWAYNRLRYGVHCRYYMKKHNPQSTYDMFVLVYWTKFPDAIVYSRMCDVFELNDNGVINFCKGVFETGEELPDEIDEDKMNAETNMHLWTTITLFSLLNCKNISLQKKQTHPRLIKKQKKRHPDLPDVVVHKLRLDVPGIKKTQGTSNNPSEGTSLRWHQVRGHIADYTTGNGLFGKYHGSFYIPQHTRGTLDVGRVLKRYETKVQER